jgi:hypothetical protein
MVRSFLCAGAMVLALAAPMAQAQSRGALFVSPMGEPFRSGEPDMAPMSLWIAAADSDADSRLTLAEFLTDAMRFFARLDANRNDAATSLESTAIYDREAPEMFSAWDDTSHRQTTAERRDSIDGPVEDDQRRSAPRLDRLRGAQAYGLLHDVEPVMSCDGNFDRRVARAEFEACAARRFALIDANHDGAFTADEAPER